jgi:glutathione-regulated potassium-efflux system protein KefB
MSGAHDISLLKDASVYLASALITVPLFTRFKLGAILGYLAAGIIIGPFGFGLISDGSSSSIMGIGEFGVVLLLFVIGLELRPERLWQLRRAIFGLGLTQVLLCGALLAFIVMMLLELESGAAIVVGSALALSSTAFALQLLQERGELNTAKGETAFAILLFQDLAIVPLLALVAFLAGTSDASGQAQGLRALIGVGTIIGVILAGRFLLNPALRLIARSGARESLAAAALFVVVGTATLMSAIGLSMALGAFLAGVVLADSEFRHQLEADIEPFRGLLLGLFFIAVGMALDVQVVMHNINLVVLLVLVLLCTKIFIITMLARRFTGSWREARGIAVLIAQGGEFAFVLFASAKAANLISSSNASLLSATVTLSMAMTPLLALLNDRFDKRSALMPSIINPDVVAPQTVILCGYGRMGQVVSQFLRARGLDVMLVDASPNQIQLTRQFGNVVYFGDGRRTDVLRAAGAAQAQMLIYCLDGMAVDQTTIERVKSAFPHLQILVRAFDRRHVMQLLKGNADFVIRETYESGVALGKAALERLGVDDETILSIEQEFRRRDNERLALQAASGDLQAGRDLIFRTETPFAPAAFDIGPTD